MEHGHAVSVGRQGGTGRSRAIKRASLKLGLAAPDRYLTSAARARCRSIRWRQSAYSFVPGRYSNDLHHSSPESSRCTDVQLPSITAASRSANLKIMATSRQDASALKHRSGDSDLELRSTLSPAT